jgi:L-serine/L-threonine ammonia-lyase
VETIGSNCFYHSVSLNKQRRDWPDAELPPDFEVIEDPESRLRLSHQLRFSSAASGSLGASLPSAIALKKALQREGGITCVSVPDALAMQTVCRFADSHKHLVELSCAVSLSLAYKPSLLRRILPDAKTIVFVVCGGFKVSLEDIAVYQNVLVQESAKPSWTIHCDGRPLEVSKVE